MGYAPRRKLDTAKYPAVTPERLRASRATTERIVTPEQHRRALAYQLYCTYQHQLGQEIVEWSVLSRVSQDIYLALAETALLWRQR